MMEIAKGCWEMRVHVRTISSCSAIDAIMAEIGCKSSSDSKISLRIRIFVHKRVLKVVKFAVVIDIVQTLIFITSSSARGNCCLWPRRRGSSSMNLP